MNVSPAHVGRNDSRETVLQLHAVTAGYGRINVLHDISLEVGKGETVALLGPNGAGKTTVMRVCSGLIKPARGTVSICGRPVTGQAPYRIAREGLCLVPEGLAVFPSLTVGENLELFARPGTPSSVRDEVLGLFPEISGRLKQTAGTLSGGERQMLALARAYMTKPEVVLLDEVSFGLAPQVVERLFTRLGELKQLGVALLFVEQYIEHALRAADHVYVLQQGVVTMDSPTSLVQREALVDSYLAAERK